MKIFRVHSVFLVRTVRCSKMNTRKIQMKKKSLPKKLVVPAASLRQLRPRRSSTPEQSDDEQGQLVIDWDPPSSDRNVSVTNDDISQGIQTQPLDLSTKPVRMPIYITPPDDVLIPIEIPINFKDIVNGENKTRHTRVKIGISKATVKEFGRIFKGTVIIGPLKPCNFHIRCTPDLIHNSKPTDRCNIVDVVSCKSLTAHKFPFPSTSFEVINTLPKPTIFLRKDVPSGAAVATVDLQKQAEKNPRMFVSYFIEGMPPETWRTLTVNGIPTIDGRMVYFKTPPLLKNKMHHFIVFSVFAGRRTPFSDCFCIMG